MSVSVTTDVIFLASTDMTCFDGGVSGKEKSMPKTEDQKTKDRQPKHPTTEAVSWVGGLFTEYSEQLSRYHELTAHLMSLQARIELVEKNLCVTRDHLALTIEKSEEPMPEDWRNALNRARFVGMRLADACLGLLKERKRLTHTEMLNALNLGMFRFRTNAPAREIHGALLRQPYVKRTLDGWMWNGPDIVEAQAAQEQAALRLVSQPEAITEKG